MKTFTLLIKTRFFNESIKKSNEFLSGYVIDYADYSTFVLEQLGQYRYRKLNTCILGQEDANSFILLLKSQNISQSFYCNEISLPIPEHEIERAYKSPEEYAIVLYDCYQ